MNNWNRDDDRSQKEEYPPYSRVFVVCSKTTAKDDLRKPFEEYGEIEDISMPYDKRTDGPKGVAFIKYTKTSSAAAAIDGLNQKMLPTTGKHVKVMVAVSRHEDPHQDNEYKYKRLFIKVSKDTTKEELVTYFSSFGKVQSVHLLKDKNTDMCKGFAYVLFQSFLEAALAFEGCDQKYKPVFATPKESKMNNHELKRSRNSYEDNVMYSSSSSIGRDHYSQHQPYRNEGYAQPMGGFAGKPTIKSEGYNSITVACQPSIPPKCIQRLFNIIPGMQKFNFTSDPYNNSCRASISYDDPRSAAHAVEYLNDYEFPSGETLLVEPCTNPLQKAASDLTNIVDSFKNALDGGNPDLAQLADAIAQASSLIKVATVSKIEDMQGNDLCSVRLPLPQQLAPISSPVAKRCFVICKPQPPPTGLLKDIFSRFGDLIEVTIIHRKNYGYVKYASEKAADEAINTLNGVTVRGGILLKVIVADEKKSKPDADYTGSESKRLKLNDEMI